jgi:hypothetical protein
MRAGRDYQPLSYDLRLPDEAQAERKQVFDLIHPILSDGFIRPKTDARPAGKNRKTIKEAIQALQKSLETDETAFVTMQNVLEQACNYFLEHGEFPATYEQMQRMPLLTVGLLTYAGMMEGRRVRPTALLWILMPRWLACASAFLMKQASGSGAQSRSRLPYRNVSLLA